MLQEKIKTDMVTAWKAGNKLEKDTLSFVLGRIKNKAIELRVDNLVDADVISIIQKFIKELEDERSAFEKLNRIEKVDELTNQINIITNYLPKQLSEDEIRIRINELEDKSMPSIMKYFKTNFAGQVDMSLVSRIARGN